MLLSLTFPLLSLHSPKLNLPTHPRTHPRPHATAIPPHPCFHLLPPITLLLLHTVPRTPCYTSSPVFVRSHLYRSLSLQNSVPIGLVQTLKRRVSYSMILLFFLQLNISYCPLIITLKALLLRHSSPFL